MESLISALGRVDFRVGSRSIVPQPAVRPPPTTMNWVASDCPHLAAERPNRTAGRPKPYPMMWLISIIVPNCHPCTGASPPAPSPKPAACAPLCTDSPVAAALCQRCCPTRERGCRTGLARWRTCIPFKACLRALRTAPASGAMLTVTRSATTRFVGVVKG